MFVRFVFFFCLFVVVVVGFLLLLSLLLFSVGTEATPVLRTLTPSVPLRCWHCMDVTPVDTLWTHWCNTHNTAKKSDTEKTFSSNYMHVCVTIWNFCPALVLTTLDMLCNFSLISEKKNHFIAHFLFSVIFNIK